MLRVFVVWLVLNYKAYITLCTLYEYIHMQANVNKLRVHDDKSVWEKKQNIW